MLLKPRDQAGLLAFTGVFVVQIIDLFAAVVGCQPAFQISICAELVLAWETQVSLQNGADLLWSTPFCQTRNVNWEGPCFLSASLDPKNLVGVSPPAGFDVFPRPSAHAHAHAHAQELHAPGCGAPSGVQQLHRLPHHRLRGRPRPSACFVLARIRSGEEAEGWSIQRQACGCGCFSSRLF